MTWELMLLLQTVGFAASFAVVAWATMIGLRYRRELPKLPISETIEALREQEATVREQFEGRRQELWGAERTIEEAEQQKDWLEQNRERVEGVGEALAELTRTEAALDVAEEKKAKAEATFKELTIESTKLTAALEAQRDILGRLERLKEQRDELESTVPVLKAEAVRLEQANAQGREQGVAVRDELQRLAGLQEQGQGALHDLRANASLAEAELRVHREQLKGLNKLIARHDTLEAKIPILEAQFAEVEKSLARAREDKAKQLEDVEALREDHARLSGAVQALTSERDALIKHIEALKADVQAAGGEDKDSDPCADLWQPYFGERIDPGGSVDEQKRLSLVSDHLKSCGVQMPQRTLYAFHTALKMQDMSPLTVLAGVSGTGKSLLPRIYARIMGLNLLNVPVQPRWDSPQDLFGFYNYIEHKYKATELARAMVQFDKQGRSDWPVGDTPDLSDQMLLVLLDEMNLARIEYYFSELLSRLEVRRDIDENEESARAQVAIPLEIGHGHEIKIYPGENILFSGTMNEDESTQSLSDKVLDRASVLRFGRPHQTCSVQPDLSTLPDFQPLAYEIWRKWCGNPGQSTTGDSNLIEELNALLEQVGSPFGHRVSQSIVGYVSRYPDHSERGRKCALADQIEQKIVPKLRGLDLDTHHSVLTRLADIVGGLDDTMLQGELRERMNARTGMFLWNGLDRADEV